MVAKLFLLTALPCLLAGQSATLALSVSPANSTFGAPVVLTAVVTPSTATGRVSFYDGVTLLGSMPLANGAASFSTILLPSGVRKLRAIYAAVTSNVVTQRVNTVAGGDFVPKANFNLPSYNEPVVADFNGDGRADYAYLDPATSDIKVSLGRGDGAFQPEVTTPGGSPHLLVADFNLDGIPDLFTNGNPLTLPAAVLLGNGDGTFRQAATFPSILNYPVTVGDINMDGIPDLLINNTLLVGRGDGTFDTKTFPAAGSSAISDFNNDGKPDLVVLTTDLKVVGGIFGGTDYTTSIKLFPGNGDGTFQAPVVLATETYNLSAANGYSGSEIDGFVLADCNGDGQPDLVYWGNSGYVRNGTGQRIAQVIRVRLNNGDGTFAAAKTTSTNVSDLIPVDLDGDGIIDLVVLDGNTFTVLTGKGDGTFQPAQTSYSGSPFHAVADFNGDGRPDLLVNNNGSVTLLLGAASGTGLRLIASGGTPQSTPIGNAFPTPLEVTLTINAVPVSGAAVTFTVSSQTTSSAILPVSTALTDAAGKAHITAWANEIGGGPYTVVATALGVTANFSLNNTWRGIGFPIALDALSGTPQSAAAGTPFLIPLTVRATDSDPASLQPLSGVVVRFSSPANGPTALLSNSVAVTDASGLASVTAIAGTSVGAYHVIATVGTNLTTQFALTNTAPDSTNLALGKPATQSSTLAGYLGAGAGSAVDGNTNGNFFAGSVTATNSENNPWWQVDLGSSATVAALLIYNRTDCCLSRLADYWVFLSDTPFVATDTPTTLQNRVGTFALHQTTAPSPLSNLAIGAQGRYLRIQLSGTGYLSLAEVQVFGSGGSSLSNLALAGTASQSSTLPGFPGASAQSAIDGNTDGQFYDGSVTATNADGNPWWQVDLGASFSIDSIVVWNRTDCCAERLQDYWVFLSDTPFLPGDTPDTLARRDHTYAIEQKTVPRFSALIQARGQLGRYVRIQTANGTILSLAEVQVFGSPIANLALGKPATQSSTLPGYQGDAASAAVDGNTDGRFLNASVTATNQEQYPWWQVDLGASTPISAISVWNRTDCCASRLSHYYIFYSDTPFDPSETPSDAMRHASYSELTVAPDPVTILDYLIGAQARYIRIQLAGPGILSLAEVQIFGPAGAPIANAAQGRFADQSSTLAGYPGAAASSAVDGNSDGNFFHNSVTATAFETTPWWQVDLGASKTISSVTIDNRTDCCGSRLSDYWLFISDTPFQASDTPATLQTRVATFAIHQTTAPVPSATVLAGVPGRYVRVQLTNSDYLSLAEVRVLAQ